MDNLETCLSYIKDKKVLGVDTETTGLLNQNDDLLSIQIGDEEQQFVLRPEAILHDGIRNELMEKTILMHNAKFDLGFFNKHDLYPIKNVYDTMLGERILTVDQPHLRIALDKTLYRRYQIQLQKGVRAMLEELGFDHPEFQKYAKEDVKWLPRLRRDQLKEIESLNMSKTIRLENRFVPVLTYIQNCGFRLNQDKWKEKLVQDVTHVNECRGELDRIASVNGLRPTLQEHTLFGEETKRLINWDSSGAVIPKFEVLGINVEYYDRKLKKYKKSLQANVLSKKIGTHEIIGPYMTYKGGKKLTTSYGLNYLKALSHFKDGRLRAQFTQIMDTGRLSSGGGTTKINFQNIPKVPEKKKRTREIYERECFEPDTGNVLITADYSSQESRLLAHFSKDAALTEFYNSGEGDLHSYATKMVFKAEYPEMEDMTLKEIKGKFPGLRGIMKGFNFALAYGGNANTVSDNIGIPLEEAEKYEKLYFEAFAGLRKYFKEWSDLSINKGYILINDVTNRRVPFKYYREFENKRIELCRAAGSDITPGFVGLSKDFWNLWREEKRKDSVMFTDYLKPAFSTYIKQRSSMKNNALNYPCQGTAAEMTKMAAIKMFDWILANNLLGIVLIPNVVHDELVVECPKRMAEEVSQVLVKCMESAGDIFSSIKMGADVEIGISWNH